MDERYSRQSFLGEKAQDTIEAVTIGVIGLGGGGSHIVQQLAHIGFRRYILFDNDTVEESNLNRLVSATLEDQKKGSSKILVAERVIRALQPEAEIKGFESVWQQNTDALRQCQLIFGCVDSFRGRDEIERFARRYLIAYIDIGMDVVIGRDKRSVLGGQIILSLPGHACMQCMGFLTNELLTGEAEQYGAAGSRPQVVWSNGVLASTAVGIGVDLLTDWTRNVRGSMYIEYDGNKNTLKPYPNRFSQMSCPHYPMDQVGDVVFKPV